MSDVTAAPGNADEQAIRNDHILRVTWGSSTDDGPCSSTLHRGDCSCGRWTLEREWRYDVEKAHARHVTQHLPPDRDSQPPVTDRAAYRHRVIAALAAVDGVTDAPAPVLDTLYGRRADAVLTVLPPNGEVALAALEAQYDQRVADIQAEVRRAGEAWDRQRARLDNQITSLLAQTREQPR